MKKTPLFALLALASSLVLPGAARAEDAYPSRPVRFIVPIAPGSSGDSVTRIFAEQFRTASGQPTFVENRPGADLVIATQNLVTSPADGYSVLLVSNSSLVINPFFLKDLPYRVEDLMPMATLLRSPAVLVTAPDGKYKTLGQLLDTARKAPGTVSVGVYGNTYRLGALDLTRKSGAQFNLIPYKGASQAVTDVIGGAVDAVLLDAGGALPLVTANKVAALAVGSEQRHPGMPAVPTFKEGGVPDYNLTVFMGLAVHAKTPKPVVAKLEALMEKTLARPELREQFERQAGIPFNGTPRQPFTTAIAAETERVRELVKLYGPELSR